MVGVFVEVSTFSVVVYRGKGNAGNNAVCKLTVNDTNKIAENFNTICWYYYYLVMFFRVFMTKNYDIFLLIAVIVKLSWPLSLMYNCPT